MALGPRRNDALVPDGEIDKAAVPRGLAWRGGGAQAGDRARNGAVEAKYMSFLQNSKVTSAPGYPPSLAGVHKLLICNGLRQSLLQPGAAFHSVNLQNLPVLQVAHIANQFTVVRISTMSDDIQREKMPKG
jgi:hypothetical protein